MDARRAPTAKAKGLAKLSKLGKTKQKLTKSERALDLHKMGAKEAVRGGGAARSLAGALFSSPACSQAKNISARDFKELRLIGRGNVGTVYLVRLRGTKELYAMKVLNKEDMIKCEGRVP